MVRSFQLISLGLVPFVLLLAGCSRREFFSTRSGKPLQPVFDVPALLHKNIDQLNLLLSTATQQDISYPAVVLANGHTTRERSFQLDTLTLYVTYKEDSREVYHVFLTTAHQRVANVAPLLELGNLAGNYPRLLIEPKVIEDNGSAYRGIWVCTKKQDVQLKQY